MYERIHTYTVIQATQRMYLWTETYGGMGDGPPNLRWGTAYASVPPIFREVVLSDGCESTK